MNGVIKERTELGGPGEVVGEEAGDEVVGDGRHVGGGGLGEEGGDVEDVAEERAGLGATHALLRHLPHDAPGSEPVAGEGVV